MGRADPTAKRTVCLPTLFGTVFCPCSLCSSPSGSFGPFANVCVCVSMLPSMRSCVSVRLYLYVRMFARVECFCIIACLSLRALVIVCVVGVRACSCGFVAAKSNNAPKVLPLHFLRGAPVPPARSGHFERLGAVRLSGPGSKAMASTETYLLKPPLAIGGSTSISRTIILVIRFDNPVIASTPERPF